VDTPQQFRQMLTYLVVGLVVSVVIGLIIWFLLSYQSVQVVLQKLQPDYSRIPPAAGGCESYLYDENGRAHTVGFLGDVNYMGPAPLYQVSNPVGRQVTEAPHYCPDLPEIISPTIALQGKTMYPLILSTEIVGEDKWVDIGESAILVFTATASSRAFPDRDRTSVIYAIPFTQTTIYTIYTRIDTRSFSYSPANEEIERRILKIDNQVRQIWSINPSEHTRGNQRIPITLTLIDLGTFHTVLDINIQPQFELDPRLISIVTMVGIFATWILGRLKDILEIKEKLNSKPRQQARTNKRRSK
jgi:hypothetical protein